MLNFKTANYLEGLYMIDKCRTKVVMSKQIYVGCASLDLSNMSMLEFHYNVIENILKANIIYLIVILLVLFILLNIQIFMNGWKKLNNILIYQIIHVKICKVMKIRKKLGCFKDELNGYVMSEMLGLNPKSYAFKY